MSGSISGSISDDALAKALLKKPTMTGDEVMQVFETVIDQELRADWMRSGRPLSEFMSTADLRSSLIEATKKAKQ